ncbi:MAG: Mur ligase family protein [Clostridiales bacterium]|nr:Mur ligase family protein [Clostridiales bacterium]
MEWFLGKTIIFLPLLYLLAYLALKLKHDLHMLQQNSYRNERYRRWLGQHRTEERDWFAWLPGLLLCCFLLVSSIPLKDRMILAMGFGVVFVLFALFIIILSIYMLLRLRRRFIAKKPLVMTARAKRLYTLALALPVLYILSIWILPFGALLLAYVFLPAFSGHYLMFVNWLLQPVENSINKKYLNEAKQILAGRPGLRRVAITGSYGKTSCKMILAAMLGEKYITLATPESVNTPMGITRVIREQLKPIHEIFICEMGAKQAGDIAELCELVQPQTGILTAIGPQHLETFGSEDAIANTKFELIRALPPDGLAVLNLGYAEISARKGEAPCRMAGYGWDDQPYHAEDIEYNAKGVSFTLVNPNGDRQKVESRLLGRHNIENILAAAAAAAELGLSLPQIARAVRFLDPLPHRLQLLEGYGYTIIDDAFNSNPAGAAAALSVLSLMGEGKQKILITPGMVELGEKEQELNREFALFAARVCDHIILVGKKHSLPLQQGLQEAGLPSHRYTVAADLAQARQILGQKVRPGAVVLFENDLPDTYNE